MAEALVPQDIAQRDLVDGSDELDDGDARRQNGGAAEEGAFLFLDYPMGAQPFAWIVGRGADSAEQQRQGVPLHLFFHPLDVDGEKLPIFVYDLAPGHIHHHVGAVGGVGQIVGRVMTGDEVDGLGVQKDEVGVIPLLNAPGLAAQGLSAVDGGPSPGRPTR